MSGPTVIVTPAPGGISIPAIVQQAVQALQQVQAQPLPPPATMPLTSIVAIEILGQDPERRRPLTATGTAVANAWRQGAAASRRYFALRGDGQVALATAMLPVQPTVRVTDVLGRLVPGVTVTFVLQPADGYITGGQSSQAQTNQLGEATCGNWTLGSAPGLMTLSARVNNETVVTFRAVAV